MNRNDSSRFRQFMLLVCLLGLFPIAIIYAQMPCDSPVAASLPLVIDGADEFCRVTSGSITTINSWNMELVEINGVDYTNTWSNRMPARIDGNYYIHYVGAYPWSHLEVNGSGGDSDTVPTLGTLNSVPQNDCPNLLNFADVYERP